jgi:hypothetical protein
MTESLRALLTGLIDYAGLFPPAKLPLPEALTNHVRYRASADDWMLGRFICPAARLSEFVALEHLLQSGPALVVSALGRGGATADEFLAGLATDLADLTACRQRHGGRVVIDVMELRLPHFLYQCTAVDGAAVLTRSVPGPLSLFFETPSPDRETLSSLVRSMRVAFSGRPAGFKLRTGGLEPAAFPSCEEIAFALSASLAAGVPFKATAGLHHPFPRFDPTIGTRMHGFINLFTAGVLIHARGIGADRTCAILEDNEPTHFRFTDAGLEWQELTASPEEIVRARRTVLSFGSCSFDEPRDDLRALGWL